MSAPQHRAYLMSDMYVAPDPLSLQNVCNIRTELSLSRPKSQRRCISVSAASSQAASAQGQAAAVLHSLPTEKVTFGSQNRLSLCLHICRLKCDRGKPCLNCTKRGQPESCDYIKHDSFRTRPAGVQGTTNAQLQDRVRQLEDMVMNLLKGQTALDQDVPTADKSPSAISSAGLIKDGGFTQSAAASPYIHMDPNVPKTSLGTFARARDQETFVGSEHWEAILDDITDLKIDLETPDTSEIVDFRPQILFGINHASRSEIMSSIPPKSVCDLLISRCFRTMDMAPSKFTVHLGGIEKY
jgi:hypothetical protein